MEERMGFSLGEESSRSRWIHEYMGERMGFSLGEESSSSRWIHEYRVERMGFSLGEESSSSRWIHECRVPLSPPPWPTPPTPTPATTSAMPPWPMSKFSLKRTTRLTQQTQPQDFIQRRNRTEHAVQQVTETRIS